MTNLNKNFENSLRDFRDSIERLRGPYIHKNITESFIRHAEEITFPDAIHILVTDFFDEALTYDPSCKHSIRGEYLIEALVHYAKTHQIYDRWDDTYSKVNLFLPDLEMLLVLVHGFLEKPFNSNAFIRCVGMCWSDDKYDLKFIGMKWTRRGRVILSDALMNRVPPIGSFSIENPDDHQMENL